MRIVHGSLHARPRYTHCCKKGVVRLPLPLAPPAAIKDLFEDTNFMENVRAYNNMFSMTSFGARIDNAVNDGNGPYLFKVSGQVSHWIGSICPPDNEHPRFLQLYIYDTENEVPNRLRFFQGSDHRDLSPAVVRCLADTLKSSNEYARLFTSTKDLCDTSEDCDFSVRLYNNLSDRRYEPPASGTLGGIVYAEDPNACNYDIVVHKKGGTPQRWPEISRHLEKIGGALAQNRPDIISMVFRIKVQQFLRFMRSSKTFGEITADIASGLGNVGAGPGNIAW
ncbi:hypothetical protein CASFOL_012124 [Castilleja foliolosa]|uniref:Helitron helicase-like domain-containing protein n=1 Tax=Castilleja foliolosa TaxID=1961234 RepID=A0ABD3DRZ1_9LAMI